MVSADYLAIIVGCSSLLTALGVAASGFAAIQGVRNRAAIDTNAAINNRANSVIVQSVANVANTVKRVEQHTDGLTKALVATTDKEAYARGTQDQKNSN